MIPMRISQRSTSRGLKPSVKLIGVGLQIAPARRQPKLVIFKALIAHSAKGP
jgi:hypothetical protein